MLKELFKDYQLNLNHFFDHIDCQQAEKLFELFLTCQGKLIFTGVGKSGIIAKKLATTLTSTGTLSFYLPPMNALHGDVGMISKDDLLICISKSGESEELLKLIPFVKKRGVKTIAWTSTSTCRLINACDINIHLPFVNELCPFDLAPTTSTAAQLIFGDVLTIALMKAKQFSLDEYAQNHPAGTIGKKITLRVYDLMLKGNHLPLCCPDTPLREALIKLTAKRCGCLLITDKDSYLKGIFTDGDLRRSMEKDPNRALDKPIGEIMTSHFSSINKNLLALEALKLMQQNPGKRVMMLPVLEKQKLIGLLHMHDIIQAGMNE